MIKDAPAFAILGEEFKLNLKVEDQGAVPASVGGTVQLTIAVDADAPVTFDIPVNEDHGTAGQAAACRHERAAFLGGRRCRAN